MSRSVSELSVSADARTCNGRPYTVLVLAGRSWIRPTARNCGRR